MTDPPRLAIVIRARNEADAIGGTLASLQPLRARGHEVIVVDGGSDDATPANATPLADRVIVARRTTSSSGPPRTAATC